MGGGIAMAFVAMATGCGNIPEAAPAELSGKPVAAADWSDAPADCTCGVGAADRRAELAALLDDEGRVLCVDVVDLLALEHPWLFTPPPGGHFAAVLASDPIPDPGIAEPVSDPRRSDPTRDRERSEPSPRLEEPTPEAARAGSR